VRRSGKPQPMPRSWKGSRADLIINDGIIQFKEHLVNSFANGLLRTTINSEMKAKYGFVVLIDALGTKTDSIESSERYLKAVGDVEEDIQIAHETAFRHKKKRDSKLFKNLRIRFFGDTLLLTYEIKNKSREYEYFDDLSFILRGFICNALKLGILFRGSISLGKYLEEGNIVLGPAVFDAAAWYDKLEMIGIIATPRTTVSLKSVFLHEFNGNSSGAWGDGIFDKYPLKTKDQIELYALNWPSYLDFDSELTKKSTEVLFYQLIRTFPMPFGTESKFQNTELFFQKLYRSKEWEQWSAPSDEEKKEAENFFKKV